MLALNEGIFLLLFGLVVDLFRSLIAWGTYYPEENFCNAQFSQYCSTKFNKIFFLQYSKCDRGTDYLQTIEGLSGTDSF